MYSNLDWEVGASAKPGVRPDVYYIPKSSIASFPSFAANPATAAAEVTYVGSFTLVGAETWKKLNVVDIKSPVNSEPQGEPRSKTFLNTATFVIARKDEAASAFAKSANNDDLVFIYREKEGNYRVLGNELWSTETKVGQATGGSPTDETGTTINVEVSDIMPAPFYDGEIVTDEGIVNPQS